MHKALKHVCIYNKMTWATLFKFDIASGFGKQCLASIQAAPIALFYVCLHVWLVTKQKF